MTKIFHRYFRSRLERYYLKNQWHIVLDLSLIMIIFILAAAIIFLYIYRPALPVLDPFIKPVVNLNNPPLDVTYLINDRTLDSNEPVGMNIDIKNPGTRTITAIKISLESKTPSYTVSRLTLVNNKNYSATVSGQNLLLAEIKGGQEIQISLNLSFNKPANVSRILKLDSVISYLLNGQEYRASNSLDDVYLKANLTAQAAAYYTSPQGDQLGIGPVPPIVGIPTKYWIFWDVVPGGDFRDVALSAKLPSGITLTGEKTVLSGELSYQSDNRLVVWKLPIIKPGEGNRVGFEVQLIPTEDQVGEVLTLIEAGRVFGSDILTGEEVSGSFLRQTTSLDKDKFNSGHGAVISQ